jgi:hypothetical protein
MPGTNHPLSHIDLELKVAIEAGDTRRVRLAISYGANPNAVDESGEPALEWAFDSWNPRPRIPTARMLVALGADATFEGIDNSGGLLYRATFDKQADEVEFLLAHGANPNPVMDSPETLYDLVEFDYRFDLWDLRKPLESTEGDKADEEAWLTYLDRCADYSGKQRPEHLRVLRRYGALEWKTRKTRRERRKVASIVQKVVSGGQTGSDRAALDWAIEQEVPHGGWCPVGRMAEDGRIPDRYLVAELPGSGYRQRTRQNVIVSDGTLIVNLGVLDGGTRETQRFAEKLGKPYLVIQAEPCSRAEQAEMLDQWLHAHHIATLNVAGPRESKRPGAYNATKTLMDAWLGNCFPWEGRVSGQPGEMPNK